jgi:hypothetical protein
MPVSTYFSNQNLPKEQTLLEDLIIESIKNHGIDIYYLPRGSQANVDPLFGDDPNKSFTSAFVLDVYMDFYNDDNFGGDQQFFDKFGLDVKKISKITIARRTFAKYIPSSLRNVPKEGDLIFFPVQQRLLEIKYVEEESNFFQFGKKMPYMYAIDLQTFKYSNEYFNVGIFEIDSITDQRAVTTDFILNPAGGTGSFSSPEQVYQGASLAAATATGYVVNWNAPTNTLTLKNIRGEFIDGQVIHGVDTKSQFLLGSYNFMNDSTNSYDDNVRLEDEAATLLNFDETNPFGDA